MDDEFCRSGGRGPFTQGLVMCLRTETHDIFASTAINPCLPSLSSGSVPSPPCCGSPLCVRTYVAKVVVLLVKSSLLAVHLSVWDMEDRGSDNSRGSGERSWSRKPATPHSTTLSSREIRRTLLSRRPMFLSFRRGEKCGMALRIIPRRAGRCGQIFCCERGVVRSDRRASACRWYKPAPNVCNMALPLLPLARRTCLPTENPQSEMRFACLSCQAWII